ncbi:GNAT family N-acetyltransferase, partial [Myxococcota bacterium]|nr:GNAT family N-acetyltransferase [Myxococcota bacterium]
RPQLSYLHSPRPQSFYNVVTRCRARGARVEGMIAEVSAAHRHTRSSWRVTNLGTSTPLLRGLEAAGYRLEHQHRCYALEVGALTSLAAPEALRVAHVNTMARLKDSKAAAAAAFGSSGEETEAELEQILGGCADPQGRVARFVVYAEDVAIASAGLTLFNGLGLGLLWGGGVHPAWRGRGAYRALLRARAAWCAARGIEEVGLYARLSTSAPIVWAAGFRPYGVMDDWVRPVQGEGAGEEAS